MYLSSLYLYIYIWFIMNNWLTWLRSLWCPTVGCLSNGDLVHSESADMSWGCTPESRAGEGAVAQGERRRKAEVELGLLLFCALLGACWECNQLRGAHLFRCCSRLEMLSWTHPETMLNWAPHSPVNLAHEISHHDILEVGRKSMWLLRDWRLGVSIF